jgi:hypothetical protein
MKIGGGSIGHLPIGGNERQVVPNPCDCSKPNTARACFEVVAMEFPQPAIIAQVTCGPPNNFPVIQHKTMKVKGFICPRPPS